jgi:hypothetical protein
MRTDKACAARNQHSHSNWSPFLIVPASILLTQ